MSLSVNGHVQSPEHLGHSQPGTQARDGASVSAASSPFIENAVSKSNGECARSSDELTSCHREARALAMGAHDGSDDGDISVSGTASTLGGASAATLRRRAGKKAKKAATANLAASTSQVVHADPHKDSKAMVDAEVQCHMVQTASAEMPAERTLELERKIKHLETSLANAKLRTLVWKGKFQSLRRMVGSSSDWGTSDSEMPNSGEDERSQSNATREDEDELGDSVKEPEIIPTPPEIQKLPWRERMRALGYTGESQTSGFGCHASANALQPECDIRSSVLEFNEGEIVEVHSLNAEWMNGHHGTVLCRRGDRVAVAFPAPIGNKAIKPTNLRKLEPNQ